MTTAVLSPAAAPALDFETRLALAEAAMNVRLANASAAIEVNAAHIPIDPIPHVDAAPLRTPAIAPCPYPTPVAATLWRARNHLQNNGWCAGALRDEQGAVCLMGAIRAAASAGAADDAVTVLFEAIRRDFPDATSVPAWNDQRATLHLADRYLDRAAELAHARNL
ncbi:DUF6197 family protein [Streptomyces rishiriensis]|uniref:DUF6197 family protein n=1 Tax=Streptomyces rishiriensis TaxID=68264 RepID=UPI001FE95133|nr:hypothetical protein [Streptomyces rishiriensis]